jgi:putative ABC transport system substrate-binding protein
MRDAGYVEGRDIVIEWRSANGSYDQVPRLAGDLVSSKVDVIVVETTVAARALQAATSTVPVVMVLVADPVGSGLVASLARPGGNVTGLSLMSTDIATKRLQLLKETVPRAARVAVLWNPDTPYHAAVVKEIKAAAPSLSIEPHFVELQRPYDLDRAFSTIVKEHLQALYVVGGPPSSGHPTRLLDLVSKARLPAIYGAREFADGGGLMSYGANSADQFRRAADYVDKILRGTKPGDLPIEQPPKFEFVVNLKTAKALGITIPESILLRADEVIR